MFYNSKLTRLYYQMTKEQLVEQHKSFESKIIYMIDCFILLYSLRILFMIYVISNNYETDYNFRKYDIFLSSFHLSSHSQESFLLINIYMFEIFNFICYHSLYHLDVTKITWRWWHQLVVENQDNYDKCRLSERQLAEIYEHKQAQIFTKIANLKISLIIPKFLIRIVSRPAARLIVWFHLDNVNKKRLFAKRLSILPNLSIKLRTRLLLLFHIWDILCFIAQLIVASLYISFFLENVVTKYHFYSHPWYVILWTGIDLCMFYYSLMSMIRAALFFTLCSIFGTVVYAGHVREVGQKITKLINRYRSFGRLPTLCKSMLKHQLAEHNLVCYLVVCGSKELFGWVLFAFLLTNIPINIFLIRRIFFVKHSILDLCAMLTVIMGQCAAATIVIAPLAWCCTVYHSPKQFIPRLQLMTSGKSWMKYKMKYDDLYNRLLQGPKFALSFGPVTAITYRSALEFTFFYIGYLLVAFGKQIEAQVKKKSH